jgi:hypothetical protein
MAATRKYFLIHEGNNEAHSELKSLQCTAGEETTFSLKKIKNVAPWEQSIVDNTFLFH